MNSDKEKSDKPLSEARQKFRDHIISRLRQTATNMLMQISVPIHEEELYRSLIPEHNYRTMLRASYLMPPISKYSYVINQAFRVQFLPNYSQSMEFSINNFGDNDRINWLWPVELNLITQESKLGEILLPIVDIAIQWQTTRDLLKLFILKTTPAVTMYMLPWLRLYLHDIRSKFATWTDADIKTETEKYLTIGTPRFTPGVSQWFNNVCQYGTELLSTASLVKDKKLEIAEGHVIVLPILSYSLAEDGLLDQFFAFRTLLNLPYKEAQQ